ncbi:MAG TPA: ComEC/Rec2 family competence protein [Rhabdaerophilum sp.]|nr:ComEC/Rec2 family competence protein [Rhabdaerophilum sp.]
MFGAYHFHRVATLGLVANLAAAPLVSLIIMPFAVLGMVMMPFGLDGPFFAVMGEGLTWMIAVTEWFAARSPLDAVGAIPPGAVVWLTLALVAATLLTTWLRALAIPVGLVGLLLIAARPMPDLLVSEDGRLVAVRTDQGLAVNRTRPNSFTLDNWLMAMHAGERVRPQQVSSSAGAPTSHAATSSGGALPGEADTAAFNCTRDACAIRARDGSLIVWAASADVADDYCEAAAVIVVDDATRSEPCKGTAAAVITKQDLALAGSASIQLATSSGVSITYALGAPQRPWHSHRQFSREARGLAPYQRKPRAPQIGGTAPATPDQGF